MIVLIVSILLSNCPNNQYTAAQVEMKLIGRLSLAICSWTEVLTGDSSEHGVDTTMDTTPTATQLPHKLGGTPELEVCVCA